MTTPKSLAIAAILLGSTAAAFAQGAGIGPNGENLPPQSAYGLNGYGYGYDYNAQWADDWNVGSNRPIYNNYGSGIPAYGYRPAYDYNSGAVAEPLQTVETITTVRTIRPVTRSHLHPQIVTTQTTVRRVAADTNSRLLYDYAGTTTPVVSAPAYRRAAYYGAHYSQPLYDVVGSPLAQTVGTGIIAAPLYRYVYQSDRILVVDPSTNVVIQAIPR
jgi:hypothetical protein